MVDSPRSRVRRKTSKLGAQGCVLSRERVQIWGVNEHIVKSISHEDWSLRGPEESSPSFISESIARSGVEWTLAIGFSI